MIEQTLSLPQLWVTFCTKVMGRRVVRDVGVLTIANGIAAVLGFLQGVLVARWLEPQQYGVAMLVMSYPSMVYTLFNARSSEVSVKYLSEFHARGEHERALAMCKLGYAVDLVIAVVAFTVVRLTAPWAAQNIAHEPDAVGLMVVSAAALVPNALVGTSSSTLATFGRFSLIAKINTLITLLRTVVILGLVGSGWQISGVIWGNAITTLVAGLSYGTCASMLTHRVWHAFPFQGKWQALKGRHQEIIACLAYNDLSTLLGMVPKQLDIALLGYLRDPMEAGYYRLAKSLAGEGVNYIVQPLQSVAYHELARLWHIRDRHLLRQTASRLALGLGLPLGVAVLGSAFLAPIVLPALVGPLYSPAVPAVQVLAIGSAFWLAFFWVRPVYFTLGNMKMWTIAMGLYAAGFLVLSISLTRNFGHIGMSISTGLTIATFHVVLTGRLILDKRLKCD